MPIECKLITKVSKKTGEVYECLQIQLTPTLKKLVFLTKAEIELLKLQNKTK